MKLLLFGLPLLAGALAMLIFSYFDPTTLFIAGAVCTFLGAINLLSLSRGFGAGASANDTSDAVQLLRDQGSVGRSAEGFNDHI